MQYDNHVNVLKHTIHSIDRQYITVIPKKKKKKGKVYTKYLIATGSKEERGIELGSDTKENSYLVTFQFFYEKKGKKFKSKHNRKFGIFK